MAIGSVCMFLMGCGAKTVDSDKSGVEKQEVEEIKVTEEDTALGDTDAEEKEN